MSGGAQQAVKATDAIAIYRDQDEIMTPYQVPDGPMDAKQPSSSQDSHCKMQEAMEQLDAMTAAEPISNEDLVPSQFPGSAPNYLRRKLVDPRAEKKKLQEMPVKERINYIFAQKMK